MKRTCQWSKKGSSGKFFFIGACVLGLGLAPLCAQLDFNRNGVSEIWELRYPGLLLDGSDADGDGFSNLEEAIAGTDPNSSQEFLSVDTLVFASGNLELQWQGVAGKLYEVEKFDANSGLWESVVTLPPVNAGSLRTAGILQEEGGIFRLIVRDFDGDQDGLTAWEEAQLGWDDGNIESSGQLGSSDYIAALRGLESESGLPLGGGGVLPQRLPSDEEAARFLLRSSFGPNEASIAEVKSLGYTGWFDRQISLPVITLQSIMSQNGLSLDSSSMRNAWWRAANISESQLRHRIAYALSQIMVVNLDGGSVVGDNVITQVKYYDIFVKGAFQTYREILEDVTYSPVMGFYLSHMNNRKADDPVNPTRFPDENFAREIMQLFTVGLWELNPDGSRKLNGEGQFIPTYDNTTITEMARVFTGMSNSTANSGAPATSFFSIARGNDYWNPMVVWDSEHDPDPKTIINGVHLDGTQTGEEEVQATLDALIEHDNTGPFIGRLLIQRFTSSNPSPAYLARVSRAWGTGRAVDKGHLDRVMEAILLDPESLNPGATNAFLGKVREPILRFSSLFRAFNFRRSSGKYAVDIPTLKDNFGQFPSLSPTVFNFYLPDFKPAGELREASKSSPELQLATVTQLLRSDSRFSSTIDNGHSLAVSDFADELLLAGDVAALVDRVDLLLTGRQLGPETRTTIITAVEAQPNDLEKVRTAVHLVSQAMECIILK